MDTAKALAAIQRAEVALLEAREALGQAGGGRPRQSAGTTGVKVPFGKNKGLDIGDPRVPDKDLRYLREATTRSMNDPSKERFYEQNAAFIRALDAELDRREGSGEPQQHDFGPDTGDIPF